MGSATGSAAYTRGSSMIVPPAELAWMPSWAEEVTVAAGTFPARRFQFMDDGTSGMDGAHPPYELWVTDDEDAIFLKGGVGGYMLTWYELVELRR